MFLNTAEDEWAPTSLKSTRRYERDICAQGDPKALTETQVRCVLV